MPHPTVIIGLVLYSFSLLSYGASIATPAAGERSSGMLAGAEKDTKPGQATNIIMTVTNDGTWCRAIVTLFARNVQEGPFAVDLGLASPTATVMTNLDEFWVVLSAITNRFTAGLPVEVRMWVINQTLKRTAARLSFAPHSRPRFGELEVIQTDTGKRLSFCAAPLRWNVEDWVELSPASPARIDFNLTDDYGLKQPGTYSVRFRGKLPSPHHPEREIDFLTEPLLLAVEGIGTNVPVIGPKPSANVVPALPPESTQPSQSATPPATVAASQATPLENAPPATRYWLIPAAAALAATVFLLARIWTRRH
jgi:hypothetical protein